MPDESTTAAAQIAGALRLNPELLHVAECYGGKNEPEILRHAHVYTTTEGGIVVEAYNTRSLFSIEIGGNASAPEFLCDCDTLLKRPDINAIREKAEGEVIEIATEKVDDHGGHYRSTVIRYGSDSTTTTAHATSEDFPNLQGIRDREALRPGLRRSMNIVELVRAVRKMAFAAKNLGDIDNMDVVMPLDDPSAPLRFILEEGRTTVSAIVKPVGELVPRPAVRWAELAKVVANLLEAANADGELGLGSMELHQYAEKLRSLAARALSNAALKAGDTDAEPVQLTFDETLDLVKQHEKAEEDRKAREKAEKGHGDTPDMMPADDGTTFDANERHCARPDDDLGDIPEDDALFEDEPGDLDVKDEATAETAADIVAGLRRTKKK